MTDMQRFATLLTVLALLCFAAAPVQATGPRQKTRTEYVVTERNPFTGGLQNSRRFLDRDAANLFYAKVAQGHWVKWRFIGINEPLRYRRFSTAAEAQNFITTDGPSKTGKLGFALLTNETSAVAARVSYTTQVVSVNGGGAGGGNGNGNQPDVGGIIDRIIGIIDR
jgi:hypothetical protein